MYIRELTTFITVADQGSFLKAAQELYITPASVMNQMNKLESIVGAKLIERTNQGTTLTAAGRSIYQSAKSKKRKALLIPNRLESGLVHPFCVPANGSLICGTRLIMESCRFK